MFFPKSLLFSVPLIFLRIENEDDRQFVTELYQKYKLSMYYTALRIVEDKDLAEDLVQGSCVAIIKKLDRIKGVEICKRRSYIVSLVRNLSVNYAVKHGRRSKYSFTAGDELLARQIDPNGDVEGELIRQCDNETLRLALAALSEKDRTILRMKYLDNLADAEIANYLNIKANSVRYYLTLARRRLYDAVRKIEKE